MRLNSQTAQLSRANCGARVALSHQILCEKKKHCGPGVLDFIGDLFITQRSGPRDFPDVFAVRVADPRPRHVRALGHGVAVQRETVLLHHDVRGTVVRVPRVVQGAHLGLRALELRQEVGLQQLPGHLAAAQDLPRLGPGVVQYPAPVLAHQHAVQQVARLQVREHDVQHQVRQVLGRVIHVHRRSRVRRAVLAVRRRRRHRRCRQSRHARILDMPPAWVSRVLSSR